jgi:hypothetical protein
MSERRGLSRRDKPGGSLKGTLLAPLTIDAPVRPGTCSIGFKGSQRRAKTVNNDRNKARESLVNPAGGGRCRVSGPNTPALTATGLANGDDLAVADYNLNGGVSILINDGKGALVAIKGRFGCKVDLACRAGPELAATKVPPGKRDVLQNQARCYSSHSGSLDFDDPIPSKL